MPPSTALDSPTRFLLGALARGLTLRDVSEITGEPAPALQKRLRIATARAGLPAPSPAAGASALIGAAAPLIKAAGSAAASAPATACPGDDVVAELAAGRLAGPLVLATIEHAADCAECLGRLISQRRRGPVAFAVDPPRRPSSLGLSGAQRTIVLAVLLVAVLIFALLL